jgi:hypothetical protein
VRRGQWEDRLAASISPPSSLSGSTHRLIACSQAQDSHRRRVMRSRRRPGMGRTTASPFFRIREGACIARPLFVLFDATFVPSSFKLQASSFKAGKTWKCLREHTLASSSLSATPSSGRSPCQSPAGGGWRVKAGELGSKEGWKPEPFGTLGCRRAAANRWLARMTMSK